MIRQLRHLLWGLFNRLARFLETRFPRTFPGGPGGNFLSGDEQLLVINRSLDSTFSLIGVQIVPYDDSCAVCKALTNKVYSLESRPPIPVAGCPHAHRCRAIYAPVIDYGLYKVSQLIAENPDLKGRELRRLLQNDVEAKSKGA